MQPNKNLEKFLENGLRKIVRALAKYKEDVEIGTFQEADKVIAQIRVNFADQGKIIGKEKVNFKALQTLVSLVSSKFDCQCKLDEVLPSAVGQTEPRAEFKNNPNWKSQEIQDLMNEALAMFTKKKVGVVLQEDSTTSYFRIKFSRSEEFPIAVGVIAFALSKIFHAIGRANGRLIYVTAESCDGD